MQCTPPQGKQSFESQPQNNASRRPFVNWLELKTGMSAIGITRNGFAEGSAEWHGDARQNEELDLPRKEEKDVDLSSSTSATTGSVIVVDNLDPKSLNWDLSMWLSSIIGFFEQQLVNYISGWSEKMEKLEYY